MQGLGGKACQALTNYFSWGDRAFKGGSTEAEAWLGKCSAVQKVVLLSQFIHLQQKYPFCLKYKYMFWPLSLVWKEKLRLLHVEQGECSRTRCAKSRRHV